MNATHTQDRRRRAEAGFTLVEIMVVIVILGLLATMVAKNVIGVSEEARIKTAQTSVHTIADAIELYCVKNGSLPSSIEALTAEEKGGPYIKQLEKDPWDHDFVLRGETKKDYEVLSLGPDGSENTEDDISSRKKKE